MAVYKLVYSWVGQKPKKHHQWQELVAVTGQGKQTWFATCSKLACTNLQNI